MRRAQNTVKRGSFCGRGCRRLGRRPLSPTGHLWKMLKVNKFTHLISVATRWIVHQPSGKTVQDHLPPPPSHPAGDDQKTHFLDVLT